MEQVLAILDGEERYVSRLLQYLSSQRELVFSTAAFTSEEKLSDYMERHRIAMLLCEESIYGRLERIPECPIMLLSDRSYVREPGGPPVVFKFQSASEILREILLYYEEVYPGQQAIPKTGHTQIATVLSSSGGAGVTTLAESLAQELSKQNKVLFLSFDPFYFCELQGDAREDALSEAIYYVKQKSEKGMQKLNSLLGRKENLSYLCGVAHWADISECNSEEMILLLQELAKQGSYDYVIIDAGEFTDALAGAMFLSEYLFLLTKEKKEHRKKEELFLRQASFRMPESEKRMIRIPHTDRESMLGQMHLALRAERRE
ncbi:MAG: hypothetical protein IJY09_02810 [Lachnospiraceae bacterium]|nr:hypothetical protein [Lachnospiraceae bacterium]